MAEISGKKRYSKDCFVVMVILLKDLSHAMASLSSEEGVQS